MRRSSYALAVPMLLLAIATPAAAADRFSLFAGFQPSLTYSSTHGFDYDAGVAFAVGVPWGERWSAELQGAFRDFGVMHTSQKSTTLYTGSTRSSDLALFYRFTEAGRWSLRAGGGVRFAEREGNGTREVTGPDSTRWAATLNFVADYRLTERLDLRLDGRRPLLTLSGDDDLDGASDLSLGLKMKF